MQFKDIVGQQDIANRLTEIIDSGRVSHAQLVLGNTATGSMAMALAYLQYLCCEHRQHHEGGELRADSCGECPSCKKIASLVHPDLHFIFPHGYTTPAGTDNSGSEVMAEQYRQFLRDNGAMGDYEAWLAALDEEKKSLMIKETDAAYMVRTIGLKAYEGGWKMVVVWLPERMNGSAANELLKTLEEPSDNTLILMVCESDERLLSTIRSRVQYIRLHPVERPLASEVAELYASMMVPWLRMLFKLKMRELSAQVDKMASLSRDQLMGMLRYTLDVMHRCFLASVAGMPQTLGTGDAKFDASFAAMITVRDIEPIQAALDDAVFAIGRNANAKIALMELSFRLSKALKKR